MKLSNHKQPTSANWTKAAAVCAVIGTAIAGTAFAQSNMTLGIVAAILGAMPSVVAVFTTNKN